MADGEVAAPEENCEYSVVLGSSLVDAGAEESRDDEAHNADAAYALFQYKFTPASVDATIPGLVSIDESHGATVLRGSVAKSVDGGGITFKGKIAEQKETECLLIFDGTSFRLERCDYVVSQLRHVRAAPLQRPPPSAYPAPQSKKPLRLGAAARAGKPRRPAKGARTTTAKRATDDQSRQTTSGASGLASSEPSFAQASPSTSTMGGDGDRDVLIPGPSKRPRNDE